MDCAIIKQTMKPNNQTGQRVARIAKLVLLFAIGIALAFFLQLSNSFSQKGADFSFVNSLKNVDAQAVVLQPSGSFFTNPDANQDNILILGIPGKGNDAPNLSDTIMVASLNYQTKKMALFSLPRDLWIKIDDRNYYTKLNALYQMQKDDLSIIKDKAEQITGLTIDHYIVVDLEAVKNIIDGINGVNIEVPKDINDYLYPGPGHSYEPLHLTAGWQMMDGDTATKYMRTRHQDNDYGRMARQQQVIKAAAEKILSLDPFWNFQTYFNILGNAWSKIKTNLSILEIKDLWGAIYQLKPENLKTYTFEAGQPDSLFKESKINLSDGVASILLPKAGVEDYSEIKDYINNILDN